MDLKQQKWDTTWLLFAQMMADRHSKCASKSVACVIVKDEKPISIGINGTPSQHVNCNEIFLKQQGTLYKSIRENVSESDTTIHNGHVFYHCNNQEEHHEWSKQHEIHAEINALGKLAADSTSARHATAYVTHSPCHACSLALIASKIDRVVYATGYEYGDGLNLMRQSGMDVVHLPLTEQYFLERILDKDL
ncbi:deaminase [Exiguobacterium sp. s193]|uniref:deoxycytidylate deaminase n=1 Tax=Exiguobacterium sp. s193 TaxID=2751207 RepID=UPI001BE87BDE|nr:deaminase [Exiguobacterium sp. s193]